MLTGHEQHSAHNVGCADAFSPANHFKHASSLDCIVGISSVRLVCSYSAATLDTDSCLPECMGRHHGRCSRSCTSAEVHRSNSHADRMEHFCARFTVLLLPLNCAVPDHFINELAGFQSCVAFSLWHHRRRTFRGNDFFIRYESNDKLITHCSRLPQRIAGVPRSETPKPLDAALPVAIVHHIEAPIQIDSDGLVWSVFVLCVFLCKSCLKQVKVTRLASKMV